MARVGVTLLLCAALCGLAQAQNNPTQWRCRMDPGVDGRFCGLPYELSNFQGLFECANGVKVGRPRTIEELQALVTMFPRAKAVGMGASFNKEFFCAGSNSTSINIVMTEISNVLDFIMRAPSPADYVNKSLPLDFPIQIDEDAQTVTVAAGVPQRMLLDWLAEYRYGKQPAGWTLQAFSWFIDQTIGGAVATGTHGSTLQYGSLSNQVLSMKVVKADGSIVEVSPRTNRHLWRAMGVSVGRLGIITELTLKLRVQQAVEKKVSEPSFNEWVRQIKEMQEQYKAARAAGDAVALRRAMSAVDELQTFWFVPTANMWKAEFSYLNKEPLAVMLNVDIQEMDPMVQAFAGPSDAVFNQLEKAAVRPRTELARNARYWSNFYQTAGRQYVVPGVYEARKAYLSMTEEGTRLHSGYAGYDQYEVSIPLEIAADCMAEVGAEIYGRKALWNGFRTPALIRFVMGEEFYLSNTNGGPRMFINMEDYVSRQTGRRNEEFLTTLRMFKERCNARLHWGKAGWTEFTPCFDGAQEYPDTWCHFGCAVQELDPNSKFASESTAWRWNATRAGRPVPMSSCCGPNGFSQECQCERRTSCK